MKSRSFIKNLVLISMIASFLILALTGLIKFKEIFRFTRISYDLLPMKDISLIHDWSGLLLIILIAVHLIIQRKWFVYLWKELKRSYEESSKGLLLLLVVVFVTLFGFYMYRLFKPVMETNEAIKELEGVEVREYEGEDLSSIAQFRENSIEGPQYVDIQEYELSVTGLLSEEKAYTYEEVLDFQSYQKVVTLYCVEGWNVKILWEGVLLADILNDAGIEEDANTVIFNAYDGYSTSLPLDYILENEILLAYKMNEVTLPPERGYPFQLVAEDKYGYKWIKWVTEIELSDDESFKGYWERAGYNQDADVDGPIFEE